MAGEDEEETYSESATGVESLCRVLFHSINVLCVNQRVSSHAVLCNKMFPIKRRIDAMRYGLEKGALSKAVEEALKLWIEKRRVSTGETGY